MRAYLPSKASEPGPPVRHPLFEFSLVHDDSFNSDGYVVCPRPFLAPDFLAELRQHVDELMRRRRGDEWFTSFDLPLSLDWIQRLAADSALQQALRMHYRSPALLSAHLFCKPTGRAAALAAGQQLIWHQDAALSSTTVWLPRTAWTRATER